VAHEAIDKAVEALKSVKTGWVTRRDAADFLGTAAMRAVKALRAHLNEPDVDVLRAVTEHLGKLSGAVSGIAPTAERRRHSVEELAKACAKEGSRTVSSCEAGFQVEVKLRNGRRQIVFIVPETRKDGAELVRVFSFCGLPTESSFKWALQANAKLSNSTIALTSEKGEEQLVLSRTFWADDATPFQVKVTVKEIAFYGDWMEQKLTGADEQ
jgi:hypothetical protein